MGTDTRARNAMNTVNSDAMPSGDPHADWMDRLLAADAAGQAGDYIVDQGFTARVMQRLPLAGALPAWRRPAVIALWAVAGMLLAMALPGVAFDVARAAYKLFAARPFALSTVAAMVIAIGAVSWTAAAVALRRD
jgi:hypothetical protein